MASRKYEKLKKQKDAAISDIKNETVKLEVVSEEAKRVSEVSRNVSIILGDLDKQFEQATKLIDPFHQGKAQYTFENICKEDNSLSMGDEATKIFLNSDSDMDDVGKELRAFLDYVKGIKVTDDDFIDRLEEAVKKAKANKKWRRDYMTMEMLERVKYEEGREEGRKEEMERGITALVSTLKDMNVPIQTILEKVQEKFNLSLETAKKYI